MNLTFSVTNVCQSKCRTCNIWELYRKNPAKRGEELSLDEIERVFRSMGHIYVFNVSGGEPFLRADITEIVEAACRYLTPGIIHIPTNGIASERIERKILEILAMLKARYPSIRLTIKPSLDHIGNKHDEIRRVPGNFKKVMALFNRLKALQTNYPQLHVELGTVISTWNVNDIEGIARFVTELGVDSYRNEIAEQRTEMFNTENPITPASDQYERAVNFFVRRMKSGMKHRTFFHRITNGFRLVYYDLAIRILKEDRQIIPCYAGISNVHLSPYGDIWACCTLGYEESMGNVRQYNYDFQTAWNSPRAQEVRARIRKGQCCCPLANQTYSNLLLHGPSLVRVLHQIFAGSGVKG